MLADAMSSMGSFRLESTIRPRLAVSDLTFSHTGDLLLAAGIRTRRIVESNIVSRIWRRGSLSPLFEVSHPGWQVRTGFSPDDTQFVLAGSGLLLCDAKSGSTVAHIRRGGQDVRDWAFSSNGKWLAVGFSDGHIYLLDSVTMSEASSCRIEATDYLLSFSHGDRQLAVAFHFRRAATIGLHSLPTLDCVKTLKSSHRGSILDFSANSPGRLMSLVMDGKYVLWDPARASQQFHGFTAPERVSDLCYCASGNRIIFAHNQLKKMRSPKRIVINGYLTDLDLSSGISQSPLLAHDDTILAITYSQAAKRVASATSSQIKIWHRESCVEEAVQHAS